MARTGVSENRRAQQQEELQQGAAFASGQKAISNFKQGEQTLEKGGEVGANPYLSPQYLASVNRLQAGTLDAENNAAKTNIQALNRRTGGMNGTATTGAIKDLALQKMRLGDQLSSERSAGDFNRNLSWQQQLLQNRLSPAAAQEGFYGTATGGRSSSLKNLSDLGVAAYGPWMAAIQAAGQAASAGLSGGGGGGGRGGGGCWIAEAIYGETAWETTLLRSWLNNEFTRHWYGKIVMKLYLRFGERIAAHVKRSRLTKKLFKPWFNLALDTAKAERGIA